MYLLGVGTMGLPSTERDVSENVLGFFTATRRTNWNQYIYNLYFTERRIIFARLGGEASPPYGGNPGTVFLQSIFYPLVEGRKQKKQQETKKTYDQMTPQEIADCKDNFGVFYHDISSVTVKGKGIPKVTFNFFRKQKFECDKIDFELNVALSKPDEILRSAGELLHRFLPFKLDNQLKDTKYWHKRSIFENQQPSS
jgi:hypothetical protein